MKIKLLRANSKPPILATKGAAGYDVFAAVDYPVLVGNREPVFVGLGFCIEIPEGFVGLLLPRSGLATKKGITIANTVGVIDSDYRGEVFAPLIGRENWAVTIEPGDRIAQLVVVPIHTPELQVVDTLSETGRGEGGFGSTGK